VERPDGSRRRLHVAGSAAGKERQVWVSGRLFNYERIQPQRQRPAPTDGSLAASIPAVVSQILVAPGDEVSAGDKLILLESMKMIIPIQAPYDGRVRRLNCAVGDSVAAGVQLLELEPTIH
jgi:biotin carboxyl carrier protein